MEAIDDMDIYDANFLKELKKYELKYRYGIILRKIREQERYSQEAFAEKLGCTVTTLRNAETGNVNVRDRDKNIKNKDYTLSIQYALKIRDEFGYTLDFIYARSGRVKDEEGKFYVDIRKILKIKSVKIIKKDGDALISKVIKKLVVSFGNNIFRHLDEVCDIESRKKDGSLSNKEYHTLMESLNNEFCFSNASIYKYGELPVDKLVDKANNHDVEDMSIYIPVFEFPQNSASNVQQTVAA